MSDREGKSKISLGGAKADLWVDIMLYHSTILETDSGLTEEIILETEMEKYCLCLSASFEKYRRSEKPVVARF